ncbi:MAG: hypothetical protein D6693_00540 [Planctomycetota bacterium]|nr:MAG: hypothetical protein D6693_00540 [Planctomycetota bacterium]
MTSLLTLAALAAPAPAPAQPIDPLRIGGATFEVVATIPVPDNPHGTAFSADGSRAYVACSGADVIAEIDTETYEVLRTLEAGATPLDVTLAPDGDALIATQFRGESLVRVPLAGGAIEPVQRVGAGGSLFTPRAVRGGRRYLVSEFADLLSEINPDGSLRRVWAAADRPYPASVTRDGILVFTPLRASGEVMVLDTLNDRVRARAPVGAQPEGGALTNDDVSYVAASGGANELAFINTASFEVETVVRDGVGPRPFSVTMTADDGLALVNNAGGSTLSVLDLDARAVVGSIPVGRIPIVVRAHPDGERFFVSCEGDHVVSVVRMTRHTPAPPASMNKTEVLVLGMIHGGHRTSERYGLDVVRGVIRAFRPDDVCAEIPPNRLVAAAQQWRDTHAITEPRVSRFPEYVDALFPLTDEMGFTIVPCAGWTAEMNDYRNAALARIQRDPARADQWRAHLEAMAEMGRRLDEIDGRDNPRVIHSPAYDRVIKAGYGGPYDEFFNDDLDDGGWSRINAKHWALIERHLDAVRGGGRRVLITFGAAHKYWFLERLAQRDDVTLLDAAPYLDAAGAP